MLFLQFWFTKCSQKHNFNATSRDNMKILVNPRKKKFNDDKVYTSNLVYKEVFV